MSVGLNFQLSAQVGDPFGTFTPFKYWKSREGYSSNCGAWRSRHTPQGLKSRGVKPPTCALSVPARFVQRNILSPSGVVSRRLSPQVSARQSCTPNSIKVWISSSGDAAMAWDNWRSALLSATTSADRCGRESNSLVTKTSSSRIGALRYVGTEFELLLSSAIEDTSAQTFELKEAGTPI